MTLLTLLLFGLAPTHTFANDYSKLAQDLLKEIQSHSLVKSELEALDAIGGRLSGSKEAALAVQWGKQKMESLGFQNVKLEPCLVPQWSRGNHEAASINIPGQEDQPLAITALGTSIATPAGGIEAPVVEVQSFEELNALGENSVRGKIVFYNKSFDPALDPFDAYSNTVELRTDGAAQAARLGAVATVLRSLSSLTDDDHPHTGIMQYQDSVRKIPSAALSTHGANVLSNALRANPQLTLKIELSASEVTTVASANVVGEITGSEFPKEVMILGGHLDSWDLGHGIQDDGAGVVQSLEVLRAIRALGLKPKRTIRAVLFMSEEFGGVGASQYEERLLHHPSGEKIIGALESDRGGFAPRGFCAHLSKRSYNRLKSWKPFLSLLHAGELTESDSCGTDTETLGQAGVPEMELVSDPTHYFDFHHSALDQLSAVNLSEVNQGAAAMALLSYLIAEEGFGNAGNEL